MKRVSLAPKMGVSAKPNPGQWVQTERKTHEAWAALIIKKPRAAVLAHILVAHMCSRNAVVIPQTVLAKLMKCSVDTVQRAIQDLVAAKWVSVVRLGKGKEAAYVVNDRVAWGQPREQLRLSMFSATVVADFDDQEFSLLGQGELRRIPMLYSGEQQLPTGPGEDPPSQPSIFGIEPDLPYLDKKTNEILNPEMQARYELEKLGQLRIPD